MFNAPFARLFRPPLGPALSSGVTYLLYDQFITSRPAGSVNGTNAEPTGGARTVVDTNNKLSITGGQLSFATGGSGSGNPGIWYSAQTRLAGKLLFCSVSIESLSNTGFRLGYDVNTSGGLTDEGFYFVAGPSGIVRLSDVGVAIFNASASTTYQLLIVLRTTGAYFFVKGGIFTYWTLVWPHSLLSGATLYPAITPDTDKVTAITADNIRIPDVLWLPTPLCYDTFGRADGAPGNSETTGPDGQVTPALAWTGGAIASNKLVISPTLGSSPATLANKGLEAPYSSGVADGWAQAGGAGTFTTSEENTIVHGGASSQKVVVDTSYGGIKDPSVTLIAKTWYLASVWYRTSSNNLAYFQGYDRVAMWIDGQSITVPTDTWVQVILAGRASNSGVGSSYYRFFAPIGTSYFDDTDINALTLSELFASLQTSDEDVIASVDITFPQTYQTPAAGLVTNLDSAASPANFLIAYHDGTNVKLEKCVAGTYTNLISAAATYSSGATLRVITYTSGGSLKVRVYYNNALVGTEQTVSDGGIISNTIHGLFSTYASNTFDNFTLFARGTGNEYSALDAY